MQSVGLIKPTTIYHICDCGCELEFGDVIRRVIYQDNQRTCPKVCRHHGGIVVQRKRQCMEPGCGKDFFYNKNGKNRDRCYKCSEKKKKEDAKLAKIKRQLVLSTKKSTKKNKLTIQDRNPFNCAKFKSLCDTGMPEDCVMPHFKCDAFEREYTE